MKRDASATSVKEIRTSAGGYWRAHRAACVFLSLRRHYPDQVRGVHQPDAGVSGVTHPQESAQYSV